MALLTIDISAVHKGHITGQVLLFFILQNTFCTNVLGSRVRYQKGEVETQLRGEFLWYCVHCYAEGVQY